jgi:DNA polymerase V
MRDHIRASAGLPVTVGIARTRTLAKLFSDTAKPFGAVAVLDRDHERALLSQIPVTEISGIAGRRAARIAPYGIRTCPDLAAADGRLVKKLLTKTGYELWLELNGHPVTPIRPERSPHLVLARGGSLMGNVEDPTLLWAWTVRHIE